jgi:hypothetical protein
VLQVSDADPTTVVLNRFKAARQRARAETERSGAGTLFVQLHEQLGRVKPRALFRHDKGFRVNLSGEAADDHGGPYREALAHVCNELQSDALPLFIRTPNGVNGVGEHRDAFVPDPSASSALHMEWFYFLGMLLGLALRQKETQLGLSLPSVLWKQLVAEPMDSRDLAKFDAMCAQSLDKLRHIEREGCARPIDRTRRPRLRAAALLTCRVRPIARAGRPAAHRCDTQDERSSAPTNPRAPPALAQVAQFAERRRRLADADRERYHRWAERPRLRAHGQPGGASGGGGEACGDAPCEGARDDRTEAVAAGRGGPCAALAE